MAAEVKLDAAGVAKLKTLDEALLLLQRIHGTVEQYAVAFKRGQPTSSYVMNRESAAASPTEIHLRAEHTSARRLRGHGARRRGLPARPRPVAQTQNGFTAPHQPLFLLGRVLIRLVLSGKRPRRRL